MGLREDIIEDVKDITSDPEEWGYRITMTPPGAAAYQLVGRHAKHYIGVDAMGNMVSSKHAYVGISEEVFKSVSYPLRNAGGEVFIPRHRVDVYDSTGTVKKYLVSAVFPDETVGLIIIILQDYAG